MIANVYLESTIVSYAMRNNREASNCIYCKFTDVNKIYQKLIGRKKNTPQKHNIEWFL